MNEIVEMKRLNTVYEQLEKCPNKTQFAMQTKQRPDLLPEEISNLLYQHLRLSINNEENL
jgi:hypothetical protein